jgi:hypothetical protein
MFAEFGVYPAIIIAALVAFVIGFLWHGPIFGKKWAALIGFSKKEMEAGKKKGMNKQMLITVVMNLVMASILVYVIGLAQAGTALEATMVAFWLWLGLVATVQMSPVLWEKMPLKLYLIKTGHYLVSMVVMANIILLVPVI